jgi:crossover junction endodeoxyribonuclease RuvC
VAREAGALRVLGIDPGSRKTGWGVVEKRGNVYRCLGHGTATAGPKLDMPHRIHAIAMRIEQVIVEFTPDCMAVEEAFYHESVRSTLVLGHVRGALLVAGVRHALEIAEYTPREVKMSVAGTGAGSKEQVEFMVRRMLGIKTALQADASDALAVSLCHLHRARRPAPAAALGAATRGLEALLARRVRKS